MSDYQLPLFDPAPDLRRIEGADAKATFGELGDGRVYVHDQRIVFAVQVAQKTGRPLLLQGPAGSGKSSLAPFVANKLGCRFYNHTVTARTQARDLMWEFDALGRLNDANIAATVPQARDKVTNLHNYITPSVLWWAFDRCSATLRGAGSAEALQVDPCRDPATIDPRNPDTGITYSQPGAVVLIDEIDKADPDLPNNLLEAFGSRRFTVAETGTRVVEQQPYPLILITTNNERQLPKAFLRRCITLQLRDKKAPELVTIAQAQFGDDTLNIYRPVADKVVELRRQATLDGLRAPSTAEYLDALIACRELGVTPSEAPGPAEERWRQLIEIGLRKESNGEETTEPDG